MRSPVLLWCLLFCVGPVAAQNAGNSQPGRSPERAYADAPDAEYDKNYDLPPGADPQNRLGVPFVIHLAEDQKQFWTFPSRLHIKDLRWIVPAGAGLAGLIASDTWISH